MRRVTKKLLIILFGVLLTAVYCEFIVYYVIAVQVKYFLLTLYQKMCIYYQCCVV